MDKHVNSPLSRDERAFEAGALWVVSLADEELATEEDPVLRSYLAKTSSYLRYSVLMQYEEHDPALVQRLMLDQGMLQFGHLAAIESIAGQDLFLRGGVAVRQGEPIMEFHLAPVPMLQRRKSYLYSMIAQVAAHCAELDAQQRPRLVFGNTYDKVANMAQRWLGFKVQHFNIDEHISPGHVVRIAMKQLAERNPTLFEDERYYNKMVYTDLERLKEVGKAEAD